VAQIEHILSLVRQGVSIGQVKRLLQSAQTSVDVAPLSAVDSEDPWHLYRQRMQHAIVRFDDNDLDATYNDCLALYPMDLAARQLLHPLMQQLALTKSPLDRSHRAFFLTYLRNKLAARFQHQNSASHGPRLLGAALADDEADVELLLFSLSAMPRGYRFLMLGKSEASALGEIKAQTGAAAMVIYTARHTPRQQIDDTIATISRESTGVLFVGGKGAASSPVTLQQLDVIPLSDNLSEAVAQIDKRLKQEKQA
jgi:hypothetical protein